MSEGPSSIPGSSPRDDPARYLARFRGVGRRAGLGALALLWLMFYAALSASASLWSHRPPALPPRRRTANRSGPRPRGGMHLNAHLTA